MNNYISKENAIGLKEIGYDAPTATYYRAKSAYSDGTKLEIAHEPTNVNETSWYSAPNFLDAADWLYENHSIEFWFRPNITRVFEYGGNTLERFTEVHGDHRNAAIAHAITIVKERREKGGGE